MKRFSFYFILVHALLLQGFSQSDEIVGNLGAFLQNQKQEKIYLHLGKKRYAPSESIWFKGYTIDAATYGRIQSGVVYVDLIDSAGAIVAEKSLKVEQNGTFAGEIDFPRDVQPGLFEVRAYTNWMRNFSEDFFYKEQVWLSGDDLNPQSDEDSKLSIDFFPEGGDLISGIPCIVSFRATDSRGTGADVSGVIVDDAGNELTSFQSQKFGLGKFYLVPEFGKKYRAFVDEVEYPLPEVKSSGVSMSVRNSYGSSLVQVNVRSVDVNMTGGSLIGHSNGQLIFKSDSKNSSEFSVAIPRSAFGPGLIHLTFIGRDKVPYSERLLVATMPERKEIAVSFDKEVYQNREKVKLTINASKQDSASLSMGVTPSVESHFIPQGRNILNYFFLTSDLKGQIENPDYYLQSGKESFDASDMLLRTHGWTRFRWEELLHDSFTPEHILETGITIRGQVVDYFKKEEPRKGAFTLTKFEGGFSQISGETDDSGLFSITGLDLRDTTNVSLTAHGFRGKKNKEDEWVSVLLKEYERPDTEKPVGNFYLDSAFSNKSQKLEQIIEAYNLDPDALLLDEFVKTGKRITPGDYNTRQGNIYGTPSNRIVADSVGWAQSAQSVFDLLRAVPGVQVGGSFPNQSVQIRGRTTISAGEGPLYLINGVPVDNVSLGSIPVGDIDFVDVLKGPDAAIYGSRGSGGVVAVYTKLGSSGFQKETPGIKSFLHPGYSKAKEFYSPDYSTRKQEHIVPDYRSQVYWNPEIQEAGDGYAVEFYTSDQKGVFEVRVEGMVDGYPVFQRVEFIVE